MAEERRPGEVLDDRYRLVERLGRGGFGDVWRAEELLPDGSSLRQVALKLLRGQAVSHDWSAEARIIASLRHPALVTIYAAGLLAAGSERLPFVAMELLEGENLAAFVSRGEVVPWRRVLAWARETAAALDEIHRAHVVHLDLKPANLFLSEHGRVKVLDFGIARHGHGPAPSLAMPEPIDEMSTAAFMAAQQAPVSVAPTSRSVVGTPGFMAPEIFEEGEPTHASDAYALAACIVQLATGKLPQKVGARPEVGTTASTSMQAWLSQLQEATVRGQIRDLSLEGLPEALVALLERWLALDPAARGVERGELRAQLDAVWTAPHGHTGNPFRGLSSYGLGDEGRFYGRSGDAARIARELVDAPCAILQGDGGIGLQSLALAGVVPALARTFADGRHDWRCCALTLEGADDPDARLREALAAFLGEGIGDDNGIDALVRWAAEGALGAVVVVDDLHQLASHPGEAPLLDALVSTLSERQPGLRLVGTLRSESSAAFLDSELGRRLRPWVRFIGPLGAAAVDEIVRKPAEDAGRPITGAEGVVEEIQAELAADGARLPLVSLALADWWKAEELTLASWRAGGGLVGRICHHAERVVAALADPDRAEALLVRLVAVDGSLIEVEEADLVEASDGEVLRALLAARIVARHASRIRLSHPRLADRWPRLDGRRLADLDRLEFLAELGHATRRWTLAGRPRRLLWSGEQLARVRRWLPLVARELDDDEEAFVEACLAARRLTWVVRALLAACVVAVIAAGIWIDRETQRREALQAERLEQARLEAARESMVSQARRADDPYLKVALLAGAISAGDDDPTLPLELGTAAITLPTAQFLSLDRVASPGFHWGPRWLVGTVGREVVVFDFEPPAGPEFAPLSHRFAPHHQGLADLVPFAFDTAFVTRGIDGELKVWRLREDGSISLAARSPMRCQRGLSQVLIAERAPVIACSTEEGLARWDLRRPAEVAVDPFRGRALHVSDDGRWLAAVWLDQVLLWSPDDDRRHLLEVDHAPAVARFSPRDPVIALVRPHAFDVYRLAPAPERILSRAIPDPDPVDARWDAGGLDLAICDYAGIGRHHYLREGGRHPDDPAPSDDARPCEPRRHRWPAPLRHTRDYGAILTSSQIGPRIFEGGWQLADGRVITRDLVSFELSGEGVQRVLGYRPRKPSFELGRSIQSVFAAQDVAWQVGDHIRILDRAGEELRRVEGNLLMRCPDGRLLSWRRSSDGALWELFDARHDVLFRRVERRPGFVLGADPSCTRVWFQAHEGALHAIAVDGDNQPAALESLAVAGGGYAFDGYVFDARPSAGREGQPPGLWLAGSNGALARVGADGSLTAYGRATPRATMMADGPRPGELLFADESGVMIRREGAKDELLLRRQSDHDWEDALVLDERHVLLSWAHGVAVVDRERAEIAGSARTPWRGRLARWDENGSILVWPFSFMGEPRGEILPFGRDLATTVGATASNLRARLDAEKHIVIGLD